MRIAKLVVSVVALSLGASAHAGVIDLTSIIGGANLYAIHDFSAPSSDVEGALVAGGNVTVASYSINDKNAPAGPDRVPQLMSAILQKRIRVQGFIILDHYGERFDAFRREMGAWVERGEVKLREDRVDGLENAPQAFIGLLQGRNFGKLVVRVGED